MSLIRLKWLAILAPVLFLGAVDLARHALGQGDWHHWAEYALAAGVVLLGSLAFSELIFGRVEQMRMQLAQQNRELLALHQAGLDISGDLSLETVLQKVVEQAREMLGARYGALSVPGIGGRLETFLTSGLDASERAAIGDPPVGHGLLGVVLREGERLRLANVSEDPRSHGFPPHHPPMRSLLALPIASRGRVLGNLYLAEKEGVDEFSAEDEVRLARFATQAALAIENARLHRQVRELAVTEERERIAREMHDSLAQVLGYVNTKAQAVQELLASGRVEQAAAHVGQLGEAARAAYADVREGILGLRSTVGPERGLLDTLREYLRRWQEQSEISVELHLTPAETELRSLDPTAELQLLRIIQEGLANVRKHAGATRAEVAIREVGHEVEAVIRDDGRGFDPDRLGSAGLPRFGLATMRERAEAAGGLLEVDSTPGRGTEILVRLPTSGAPRQTGTPSARADC